MCRGGRRSSVGFRNAQSFTHWHSDELAIVPTEREVSVSPRVSESTIETSKDEGIFEWLLLKKDSHCRLSFHTTSLFPKKRSISQFCINVAHGVTTSTAAIVLGYAKNSKTTKLLTALHHFGLNSGCKLGTWNQQFHF